jgi:hypothetical protein
MQNQHPSIVGTWQTSVPQSEGDPRPGFEALMTFFADGNMVDVNSMNPAISGSARGVWIDLGNTYLLTFVIFIFDDKGKHTGKFKTNLSITMNGSDHFTATYTADLIDLAGKVTKNVASGSSKSTRLEVEIP